MIHFLAFVLYLSALALWVRFLVAGSRGAGSVLASATGAAAVFVHAAGVVGYWNQFGELPLVGPGAALSSLAFVGGLALVATIPLREAGRVSIALLPFITICLGVALVLGIAPSPLAIDFQGAGFVLHVVLAFFGYQGLALAFAAGLLYLIQHHELKSKRLGRFFRFIPPLATLDRLGRFGLWGGFVALSAALVLGWGWITQNPGSLGVGDPKVVWALLSWAVFVGVILVRQRTSRREYLGALAAVLGFCTVIGSYLVLRVTVGGEGMFL